MEGWFLALVSDCDIGLFWGNCMVVVGVGMWWIHLLRDWIVLMHVFCPLKTCQRNTVLIAQICEVVEITSSSDADEEKTFIYT